VPTTDADRVHEPLDHAECLRLLATPGLGRLAYTRGALPVVQPVSFRLRDDDVLIPVGFGSPLVEAVRGAVVAFQTDSYDGITRTGWTVTVVGPSRVLGCSAPEPPRHSAAIAVHLGLVEGWRTTLPA